MVEQNSENCNNECSSCNSNCDERDQKSLIEKENAGSHVKRVIGVMSGKGGVGKSLVTALSAVTANRNGYRTAVMDADITGPSIPKMFGLHKKADSTELGILPVSTGSEIQVMSLNLLTENETDPVIWRGPILGGAVKQFWTDVIWGDIDVMFVDMPPGTGDVPLTVFQSLPIDGIIIVTSPQELVSMIVEKAVNMANMMNVPILGLVENMSYLTCPDCGNKIEVFGKSNIDEIADQKGLNVIGKIPIEPDLAQLCDNGLIEHFQGTWIDDVLKVIDDVDRKKAEKEAAAK